MAKQERAWSPKPHRAVDFNPKAIQRELDSVGCVAVGAKVDGYRAIITPLLFGLRITTREGIVFKCFDDGWLGRINAALNEAGLLRLGHSVDAELSLYGVPFDEQGGLFRSHSPLPRDAHLRITVLDYAITEAFEGPVSVEHGLRSYGDRLTEFSHLPCIVDAPTAMLTRDYIGKAEDATKILAMYELVREAGFEGLVIKSYDQLFRNGKVTGWWKLKPEIEEDGTIIDVVLGDADKGNAGKVVGFVVRLENGQTANATGFTKAFMEYATEQCQIPNNPFLGRICEVTAMERTQDGKLRHPKFKRLRDTDYAKGLKV